MKPIFYIPHIRSPYTDQNDINEAAAVLSECYSEQLGYDAVKPFFAPGGRYGEQYWSLDYALAIEGVKWLNFSYAEEFIENLTAIQSPDGRIRLYGCEGFGHIPNVQEPIGSLPKLYESAYSVARMTGREETRRAVYEIFRRNLQWWFEYRQDPQTGLITAVFEETFVPNTVSASGVYAPMDTNIEIWIGCRNTARLAAMLGQPDQEQYYNGKAQEILSAVAAYLWDEQDGCYYPYVIPQKRRYPIRTASAFLGFYVPGKERHERLLRLMTDPAEFNWDTYPLTTVSRRDPHYTTVTGVYNGNPAWLGSVWTLTNDAVIRALRYAGYAAIADELARKTVASFRNNYTEFLHPDTRSGEGVQRYGWTAAQFLRIMIEELGGIDCDNEHGVRILPHADPTVTVSSLHLPDGNVYNGN